MNKTIKLLLICNGIFVFAAGLLIPVFALFVLKIGGGAELAGILVGIQYLTSTLVSLYVVRLKDNISLSRTLLQINFIIRSLAWLIIAFFPTIPVMICAQASLGVAEAIGSPAFNSLVSENLDYKQHIKEWGMWEIIVTPSTGIASILGGFVVAHYGFGTLFITMSTLSFVSFIVYHFYILSSLNK